ncbi:MULTISPECIES: metalloregulator ArsR/SmtB family transcription factor [Streptomyces]|uniref:ArsR/SmtB family transcription factor n=1 Tax=Streptomyces TaxID=1883 RepID=UPI000F50A977|nr:MULTISPECIES: metalloregulator ArsR/SmtB family transcription factor [Streptomyces]RPE37947.1 DNA-binding transcriptional ArsR family regulator [Streptomyces sp. Ag109_O5-1]
MAGKAGGVEDPSAEVLTDAAAVFGLLASSARLHLMWALAQGESDVTHLADRVGGALPAISQHLAKLKLAGLVQARREGRRQIYYIDDPDIVTVVRVMVGQLTARSHQVPAPARRLHGTGG